MRHSNIIIAALALSAPLVTGAPPLDTGRRRDPVGDIPQPPGIGPEPVDTRSKVLARRGGPNGLEHAVRENPFAPAHAIVTASDRQRASEEAQQRADAKRARRLARREAGRW